jgi:hypothetical protein
MSRCGVGLSEDYLQLGVLSFLLIFVLPLFFTVTAKVQVIVIVFGIIDLTFFNGSFRCAIDGVILS